MARYFGQYFAGINTMTTFIFLYDLFLIINNNAFASYTDNTPYTNDESAKKVVHNLYMEAKNLFKWFSNNQMKTNPDKCNLLISSTSRSELKIGKATISLYM